MSSAASFATAAASLSPSASLPYALAASGLYSVNAAGAVCRLRAKRDSAVCNDVCGILVGALVGGVLLAVASALLYYFVMAPRKAAAASGAGATGVGAAAGAAPKKDVSDGVATSESRAPYGDDGDAAPLVTEGNLVEVQQPATAEPVIAEVAAAEYEPFSPAVTPSNAH